MDVINKIPRPLLVILILALASLFIMIGDPPKSACDAQLEVILKSQAGRLNSLRGRVNSLWVRTAKYCKETKTLGGCSEFHDTVREALRDIKSAPVECIPKLIAEDWIQKVLIDSLLLMVSIAWGENLPEIGNSTFNWMGPSELALFCDLQNNIRRSFDEENWEIFVRKTISKLPHSSELNFNEAFSRSLFSLKCESFF